MVPVTSGGNTYTMGLTQGQLAQAAAAGGYGAAAGAGLTNIGAANAAASTGTANALAGGVGQYLNYANQQDQLAAYNARTAAAKSAYIV
jgi:hypothetical protein